jgi:hypothetical protein
VVSFTPWPLYHPLYPLDRRLCRAQNQSGQCGEEKILDPTRYLLNLIDVTSLFSYSVLLIEIFSIDVHLMSSVFLQRKNKRHIDIFNVF